MFSSMFKKANLNWLNASKPAIAFAWVGLFYLITLTVIYLADTQPENLDSFSGIRIFIFFLLSPILFKYFLQVFISPFYPFSLNRYIYRRRNPMVSVLIPAWNEEVGIIKTLKSVIDSYYDKLEIIVINDGSTDKTHELIEGFLKKYATNQYKKPEIHYLNLENNGKAKALNKGIEIAKGEIVFTLDADSLMDRYTIANMIKHFKDPAVGAVAGNVIIGNKKKPLEIIQQLEYLYGFFFKRADSMFSSVYIIGGAAAAYRKTVLQKIGGFDHEIITEDIELSTRILSYGYKTKYAADAVVYTEGPSDWQALCRQRLRWKFGRLVTFFKHKKLFFSVEKKHSPYLTFLLLPLAVYSELALLFEAVLLTIFYAYTIIAGDYLPLAFVILFTSSLILMQILFDSKSRFHLNLLPFLPIAWLIFYIIDVVEFQALYRSLIKLYNKQKPQWQKWQRKGLVN